MAISARFRAGAARAGAMAARVGRAITFSQTPAVPGTALSPNVNGPSANPATTKIINSPEALMGRISYGAGPSFTRYSSYPATNLTPEKINSYLRQADLGYPLLYAEACEQILERDPHLHGIDHARRVEVSGKPYRIQPRNESPLALALAKLCRAVVDEIENFDQAVEDLLSANAYGYSASELVYAFDRIRFTDDKGKPQLLELICPRKLEWVHPKHFRFDLEKDEPYLVMGNGQVQLPPNKFVFHDTAGTGLIERRGFMRSCIWLHFTKQTGWRDWLVYSHLYGLPQIRGVYDREVFNSAEHRTAYEAILQDFGQGIPVLHPNEFEIKIDQPPVGGKSNDVHGAIIGWANAEMSKVVQGETLTTELGGTGSYNASETHADVKHAIVRADARKLGTNIRKDLLAPFIRLNMETLSKAFGASPYDISNAVPSISWRIDRETTPEVRARIISMAINEWGMKLDPAQQYDEFGLDAPRPGNDPLPGEPQAVSANAATVGSLEASEGTTNPVETSPTDPKLKGA